LPNFLADRGVNAIISGGMGGGAVEIFNKKNVEVVVGASGDANISILMNVANIVTHLYCKIVLVQYN